MNLTIVVLVNPVQYYRILVLKIHPMVAVIALHTCARGKVIVNLSVVVHTKNSPDLKLYIDLIVTCEGQQKFNCRKQRKIGFSLLEIA